MVLPFYTPWKHQKTLRVSDVFRGYWKAIPSCNGFSQKSFNKSLKWIQRYLFGLIIPEPNLVPKWLICPTWEPTSFSCTSWYLSYYQTWKKLLGQSYKNKLGLFAPNKFFPKTNNINLIYLSLPFLLQNWKKKALEQILSYDDKLFFIFDKAQNDHFPKQEFFWKSHATFIAWNKKKCYSRSRVMRAHLLPAKKSPLCPKQELLERNNSYNLHVPLDLFHCVKFKKNFLSVSKVLRMYHFRILRYISLLKLSHNPAKIVILAQKGIFGEI